LLALKKAHEPKFAQRSEQSSSQINFRLIRKTRQKDFVGYEESVKKARKAF
jgi:hypothetical protein